MNDVEAMSEARAIAIYEAVNDDASTRTPWTHLSPGEWEKWRRAANVAQQVAVPQITEAAIDEFLEDYELRGEDEDGRDACYQPTEIERALIKDAIVGLLAAAPQPPQPEARKPMTAEMVSTLTSALPQYDITDGDLVSLIRSVEAAHGIKEQP